MVSNQETSIFVFDLKAMEWKNTGIRFGEGVLRMSSAEENMLIVKVDGPNFNSDIRLYRFPMCRPDSLLNISWMKVRRWAKTKPVLYEETIQKLPHNLPVRCPWQNNL
ncbi:hypothetical protein M3Y94_00412700 [Aphelenchoides besseyi]|nr:hypothetical protein M3Y94_00412700 [Aphelenchoides besseyi]